MDILTLIIVYVVYVIGVLVYVCPPIALWVYYVSYSNAKDLDIVIDDYLSRKKPVEPPVHSSAPEYKSDWSHLVFSVVFITSFLSLLLFLAQGFEAALWFLPDSWGEYDVDLDEFTSTQESLGGIAGLAFSAVIYTFMSSVLKERVFSRKLKEFQRQRDEESKGKDSN